MSQDYAVHIGTVPTEALCQFARADSRPCHCLPEFREPGQTQFGSAAARL